MVSGGVAPCGASRALWHPYPSLMPHFCSQFGARDKGLLWVKVRTVGMCAGAWLAGPDKSLRLLVNQLEVLGAGGDRAG